jgi:hypothetical protein
LRLPRGLLLAQDVGNVIGAECVDSGSFRDRIGHRFGSVLTDEFQQFGQLPRECAIGIGDVAQVSFQHGLGTKAIQNRKETLLRPRPFGCGTEVGQLGFESIGSQSLAPAPTTGIGDDFVGPVIDGD